MDAKQQALNTVAIKHGFKDWNDLWWNADFTVDMMEDALEEYGELRFAVGLDAGLNLDVH